ncbi:hypothetical protein KQ305_14715 [Synechococcus sp. CS-1332]|nr:hypothetical protein [Synechococcus sp. CS-1332]
MEPATYLQINARRSHPFLFSLTGRGFYSEINALLNAILFGLVTRRRLCVDESVFAGGHLRWSDLYRSDLPWASGDPEEVADPRWRSIGVESTGFWTVHRLVGRWHRYRRFFLSRSFGFHANVFDAKRHLARQFCQAIVPQAEPASLASPYAAIHVRRGDKVKGYMLGGNLRIEGEDVPLTDYLTILRHRAPQLKNLFVMTDDHQVLDDLRALDPGLTVSSLCQPLEQGYEQTDFDAMEGLAKTIAVRRLLAEVDIACRSRIFIGCYKSNVSRYIALAHDHPRYCHSADAMKRWHPR